MANIFETGHTLARRQVDQIQEAGNMRPSGGWPITVIGSVEAPRTDTGKDILAEGIALSGYIQDGRSISTITANPSPHTWHEADQRQFLSTVEQVTGRANPRLPFNADAKVPEHLVVWWFGDEFKDGEPKRVDLIALAGLPPEEQAEYFRGISEKTAESVRILQLLTDINYSENQYIEIYGTFGHSPLEDRIKSGLGRGSQSSPHGHLNVVYYDYNTRFANLAEGKEPTARELLKQFGIWDTELFNDVKGSVYHILRSIVENELPPENKYKVKQLIDIGQSFRGASVPFFEGYPIEFDDYIEMETAMKIMTKVAGTFDGIYSGIHNFYKEYHKNYRDQAQRNGILHSLEQFLYDSGFQNPGTRRIIELFSEMKPTYGQINSWKKEMEDEGRERNDPDYIRLDAVGRTYESLRNRLKGPQRERMKQILKGMYPVNKTDSRQADLELEMLLRVMTDRILDPESDAKNIEFVMPGTISGSYLFDSYKLEDGKIWVKKISLASRMGSTKGVVEDLVGLIISRPENL